MPDRQTPSPEQESRLARELPDPIAENVAAVAAMHRRSEQSVSLHQRMVERLAGHLARPRSLYLVIAVVAFWLLYNTLAPRFGWRSFDPAPFQYLQMVGTVASLMIATLIYITQNRQASIAEQRDRLDVQINLLAEQKVAKLISLVEDLRRDLPNVPDRYDPEAEAMREAADPHAVLEELQRTMEAVAQEIDGNPPSEDDESEEERDAVP